MDAMSWCAEGRRSAAGSSSDCFFYDACPMGQPPQFPQSRPCPFMNSLTRS